MYGTCIFRPMKKQVLVELYGVQQWMLLLKEANPLVKQRYCLPHERNIQLQSHFFYRPMRIPVHTFYSLTTTYAAGSCRHCLVSCMRCSATRWVVFSRSRSEDQASPAGTPPLPIFTPLPPPPSLASPPQATIVTSSDGVVSTVKEQVRDWIHQQTSDFLSQWQSGVSGMTSDAGLEVVNALQKVSEHFAANNTESLNLLM